MYHRFNLINRFHSSGIDYPIHIDTISMELSILYFKGLQVKISINDAFLSLRIVFILANRADHDEIWLLVAFHLGLYCLPKYLFTVIQS